MDVDAFVAAHSPMWGRLDYLVGRARRPRRCTGAELDELVELYQRTATHLSQVRSAAPDPLLVSRLSSLVTRARSAVAGAHMPPAWRDAARFAARTFPAAVWRSRWWALGTAVVFLAVATAFGLWVGANPDVQRQLAPPDVVRELVEHEFEDYYHSAPAAAFGAQVFTNNAFVAAQALFGGLVLGLPTLFLLSSTAVNIGVIGGFMAANQRLDLFFGLLLPHGLLELTGVFIAAGVGLRLAWTVVDPGPRRRLDALAEEGGAAGAVVIGLIGVFFVAGALEGFITPSDLPTWARVGTGVLVEVAFLYGLVTLGRRAHAGGETGDLLEVLRGDRAPTV